MDRTAITLGRILLGLYFLVPGITKITGYQAMLDYMALHGIPMPELLLPLPTTVFADRGGALPHCRLSNKRKQLICLWA